MTIAVSLFALAVSYAVGAAAGPLSTSTSPLSHRSPSSPLTLAPVFEVPPNHAHNAINGSYIVILKPGSTSATIASHVNFVAGFQGRDSPLDELATGLRHIYDSHIKGYAGAFSPTLLGHLRTLPEVDYIEQDQRVFAYDIKTQKSAPWGLARISHRDKISFTSFGKYVHDPEGGEGVDVYVIDTGINIKHEQFDGRAKWGKTIPADATDSDGNGHGTHCAGTIASAKYGVAKQANVIAVKVLGDNGSGSMSDVVLGVVWASDTAAAKAKAAAADPKSTHKGSVANMSLGGGKARSLDDAVNGAVDAGMHFAVAAGNDNRDACDYSPAAAEKAVTVGASTLGDERAYFSNHGPCVDVFAPGLQILSTWIGSENATNTISGTSMASPHVAGLLAYYLSLYPTTFSPLIEEDDNLESAVALNVASMQDFLGIPRWFTNLLPRWLGGRQQQQQQPQEPEQAAPLPKKPPTLTPAQLKKAILQLASRNKLADLPAKTVNLLVFNNATVA